MLELILDLFWPTGSGKLSEHLLRRASRDQVSAESWRRGAIKQVLNQSGWLSDEVIAAGQLRQGTAPSLAAMVTGLVLIQMLLPRRSKSLPAQFVLAITSDRILAFKASGGGDSEGNYELWIKPCVRDSWPRELVRLVDLPEGPKSKGGVLDLAGERIPVTRVNLNGDPSTDEFMEALSR